MKEKMIYSYFAACSEDLYNEYGQMNPELALQHIHVFGIHLQEPFRSDGNSYTHMISVMSPRPLLEELVTYFPKITTQWTAKSHVQEDGPLPHMPLITGDTKDKKLLIKSPIKKASFRI